MGSDLGHISRLSNITKTLESEGHNVVVALKDLSRAYPFFKETNAQLLQAPVWLLKLKMQRPIACQADTLLLSGYVDIEALLMLTKAWSEIVNLVNPDAVIFDYSPTALLALRDDTRPKIITGTGFATPEAGHPIADWRHYDANDNLVAEQERVALHQINSVLKLLNKTPLQKLSELWRADRVILNNPPLFDPYYEVRANTVYCLKETTSNTHPSVTFPNTGRKKIIAYLKPKHTKLDLILHALRLSNADVFVACPRGPENILKGYECDTLKYSTKPINLAEGFENANLFIGHGNANSVKEALAAETPIIVIPLQQEQLLIGKKLQELGAGTMILNFESADALSKSINNALSNAKLSDYVKSIKKTFDKYNQTVGSAIKNCVNELIAD
jgi:hypothetical protein